MNEEIQEEVRDTICDEETLKAKYQEVPSDFFMKGMYAASDVFYMIEHKPVLLCHHSIFGRETISRLNELACNGARIYVEDSAFEGLMEQRDFFAKRNLERVEHYQTLKVEVKNLLSDTMESGKVDPDKTVEIVQNMEKKLGKVDVSFILQWTGYLREMDEYLNSHSTNVSILNGMMADWLELDNKEKRKLITVGLLHDIGKTMIPPKILNKPGKLTKEEFDIMKIHPVYSYDMLIRSGMKDKDILEGIRGHHEKMNGNGYPDGLMAREIPLFARITSIADIYDAMVSKRCYKDAESPFRVLREFYTNKFSDLDISLVDNFLDKMAGELIGKEVLLSTGRIGKVVFVEKSNFAYPLIECGGTGNVLETNKDFYCVALCSDF